LQGVAARGRQARLVGQASGHDHGAAGRHGEVQGFALQKKLRGRVKNNVYTSVRHFLRMPKLLAPDWKRLWRQV